jgi:hypothetical protein
LKRNATLWNCKEIGMQQSNATEAAHERAELISIVVRNKELRTLDLITKLDSKEVQKL